MHTRPMKALWPAARQMSASRLVAGTSMVAKYDAVVVPF